MLTVKHTTETTTYIQQTRTVFRSNNGWVMWTDENGHENEIKYGIVWVMNDHGATVAKFDLGYQNCPSVAGVAAPDVAKAG
jgi:hypothetical protein